MKKTVPQIVVKYFHEERKLFYVSLVNEARREVEANIERQYGRAKSIHKQIKYGDKEVSSSFMFNLINTDFSGWTHEIVDYVFPDAEAATNEKLKLIDQYIDLGYSYAGSDAIRIKGVYGNKATIANWGNKFNVTNMTKAKIYEKIRMMFVGAQYDVTAEDANALYWAIICPDTRGPRMKNFGSYQVDSMAKMFLFIRNLNGLDLE